MVIKHLAILNYKNIIEADIDFCPGFNCFVGNNGVGKSNILDALYHLSMCKSYFYLPENQNIRHGEEFYMLQGYYSIGGEESLEISCGVKRNQKKIFKRNKKNYDRLSDHIGIIPLVIISPADMSLIDGGSEGRRRFIDGVISQCDREYLQYLIRYNRVLTQRNSYLKESVGMSVDREMLDVLDEQLADNGEIILKKRKDFFEAFGDSFQTYYQDVTSGKERVKLSYSATVQNGNLLESLKDNFDKDRLLTYTTGGPHRDDILLELDGHQVKKIGSQGQKKSFLIAMKFAQFIYFTERREGKPLLLLDDIFDKLDSERVAHIIRIVSGSSFGQIFITDTNRENIDEILNRFNVEYKLFCVEDGGRIKT